MGKEKPAPTDTALDRMPAICICRFHMQFLRPARPGPFVGEARIPHMTNSTAFTEATLYNEAGEAAATARQTQRLFPIRRGQ